MAEQNDANIEADGMFLNLVMMLGSSAMQQLGKLVNPMTNKAEVDLEGAQFSIDMLTCLRDKTRGNLSSTEERMLSDLIASLQMNYVEATRAAGQQEKAEPKGGADKKPPTPEETKPAAEKPEAPPSSGATPEADQGKQPKYHKSYG